MLVESDAPLLLQEGETPPVRPYSPTGSGDAPVTDCDLAPRLQVGDRTIRDGNAPSNLRRDAARTGQDIGDVSRGGVVTVIEGPVRRDNYNWYKVTKDGGGEGWVAESGDTDNGCGYFFVKTAPAATSTPTLAPTATPTMTPTPVGDVNLNGWGVCLLPDAIRAANSDSAVGDCPPGGSGRDRITLLQNIALSGTLPRITSTIDVVGDGNSISGGGHRIFTVSEGGELEVIQLRLINGSARDGGAIFNDGGRFVSTSSHFIGNSASRHGGAIYSDEGSVLIWSESTFSNNSAEEDGGAIYSNDRDGSLTVQGSTFSGNTADDGGAISSYRSELSVEFSTFSRNTADRDGGAIVQRGEMELNGNEFRNNEARDGGAVHWRDGSAAVLDNTFSGNRASDDGGAYFQDYGGPGSVERNTFSNNTAEDKGGALYFDDGSASILGNSFSGNSPDDCYARDDVVVRHGECGGEIVVQTVTVPLIPQSGPAQQEVEVIEADEEHLGDEPLSQAELILMRKMTLPDEVFPKPSFSEIMSQLCDIAIDRAGRANTAKELIEQLPHVTINTLIDMQDILYDGILELHDQTDAEMEAELVGHVTVGTLLTDLPLTEGVCGGLKFALNELAATGKGLPIGYSIWKPVYDAQGITFPGATEAHIPLTNCSLKPNGYVGVRDWPEADRRPVGSIGPLVDVPAFGKITLGGKEYYIVRGKIDERSLTERAADFIRQGRSLPLGTGYIAVDQVTPSEGCVGLVDWNSVGLDAYLAPGKSDRNALGPAIFNAQVSDDDGHISQQGVELDCGKKVLNPETVTVTLCSDMFYRHCYARRGKTPKAEVLRFTDDGRVYVRLQFVGNLVTDRGWMPALHYGVEGRGISFHSDTGVVVGAVRNRFKQCLPRF